MNYRKVFLTAMMMAMALMVNAQSLAVYISDNSGSATNVRNAPKGKVVAKLNANSGIMFDVESPRNGWWKISGGVYTDPDKDMDDFRLKGSTTGYWVHYSVIGFSTSNYGGQTLHLRQSPSGESRSVYSFKTELLLRPLEVRGNWVKVVTGDGKHTGWIEKEWLCGNSVTNCC